MHLESLNEQLEYYFKGRLRARQSEVYEDRFYVEEHTARGTVAFSADLPSKNEVQRRQRRDDIIRMRDGFSFVMEVRHGEAFGCVACGARNTCPVNGTAEVRCVKCSHAHYTTTYNDLYTLVAYLRLIDPHDSSLRDRIKRDDTRQRFMAKDNDRQFGGEVGNFFRDTLIEQIPAARLSGRTTSWVQE